MQLDTQTRAGLSSPVHRTVCIQRPAVRSFCNPCASVYLSLQTGTEDHLLGLYIRSSCVYKHKLLEAKGPQPLLLATGPASHVSPRVVNSPSYGCPGASAEPLTSQCLSKH